MEVSRIGQFGRLGSATMAQRDLMPSSRELPGRSAANEGGTTEDQDSHDSVDS